jgi:hypothetical protein
MSLWGTLGGSESPTVLLRQGQHSRCLKKTLSQNVEGSGGLLLQIRSVLFEPLLGLLLRVGLKNLIEQIVHSVAIAGRRFVQDVSPEVYTEEFLGLASLPDAARERRSQSGF